MVWPGWPYLIVLLVCFIVGALGGFFLAFLNESSLNLKGYISDYFDLAAQGELGTTLFSVLWDCIRWPLAIVLFGFTSVGVIAIPVLMTVRGFLLSYSAASFGVLLGKNGVAAAGVLFAVTAVLVLPVLFMLGCEALRSACMRLPGAVGSAEKHCRLEILLPGAGVLFIAAALQWTIMPKLLSAVCFRLFS